MFSKMPSDVGGSYAHLFEWIIGDGNECRQRFLGFTTLRRLVEYLGEWFGWGPCIYQACVAITSADTTILLSGARLAFANFGLSCWCF